MKTLTIIPDDGKVILDGQLVKFDFTVDDNIHVVHWNGDYGTVEQKKGGSRRIKNVNEFKDVIKLARSTIKDKEDAIKNRKLTYKEKRSKRFRPEPQQLDVIWQFIAKCRDDGMVLPDETAAMLAEIEQIRKDIPGDTDE